MIQNKKKITRRHARECAVQALYSWQLSHNNIKEIERYVVIEQNIQDFNISYFHELYVGVINYVIEIDQLILPYLSRDLATLGYIELSILRIAIFELTQCVEVPQKVAINEAIELTKTFGSNKKSHKFVNGVLDKVAFQIRYDKYK